MQALEYSRLGLKTINGQGATGKSFIIQLQNNTVPANNILVNSPSSIVVEENYLFKLS